MNTGFVFRVAAYHGSTEVINGIPVRNCLVFDRNVPPRDVVNQPECSGLDDVIEGFEEDYGCKVSWNSLAHDGVPVYEFDVFEPSWPEQDEAQDVANDLTARVCGWVSGRR